MIDMKKWLTEQNSVKDYDDPDIDPDKVVSRHKKAVAGARDVLRDHLKIQLNKAFEKFYIEEHPEEKKLIS
ncbi:MAG: hypothetical protein ACQETH_10040 [Candidatus Rifleibacteriota bacterium]